MNFFREKVKESSKINSIALDHDVEFYLVDLLYRFIDPEVYFNVDEDLDYFSTPLALILKKALESTPDRQILLYKLLGDSSLYLCGLFQESLERKKITSDYVVSLGSGAYGKVSSLMKTMRSDSDFDRIYASLSLHFESLVKILESVSQETFRTNKIASLLKKLDELGSLQQDDLLLDLGGDDSSFLKNPR